MDIVLQVAVPAFGGFVYALSGYWDAHKEEVLDVKRMVPTIVVGTIMGVAGGMLVEGLANIPAAFAAGISGAVLVQKAIGGLK